MTTEWGKERRENDIVMRVQPATGAKILYPPDVWLGVSHRDRQHFAAVAVAAAGQGAFFATPIVD